MDKECTRNKQVLNAQKKHWEETYSEEPDFFGEKPSYPAKKAAEIFRAEGKSKILELGAGQGRDALYFASQGFQVTALDYSETAVHAIIEKADKIGISKNITALRHDVRKPLPLADASFDACYCHMLYCMALCTSELEALFKEVRRILKPKGLNVYTVRHTADPHYKQGIPRGEDMYEIKGFIVHFFSQEKIKHLAKGYEIIGTDEFERGKIAKKTIFCQTTEKRLGKEFLRYGILIISIVYLLTSEPMLSSDTRKKADKQPAKKLTGKKDCVCGSHVAATKTINSLALISLLR